MSSKGMREVAAEYVSTITKFVNDRLAPFQQRLDAVASVNAEFNKRVTELEDRLARLEDATKIRRIA